MALVVGRCVVEVRVVRAAALRALLDRFRRVAGRPVGRQPEAGFGPQERRLLHRLRHSLVLHRGGRDGFGEPAPAVADLARLEHDARQTARTIQVDLVGYREAGDARTLVYAAQDLLGQAVDALTAGHGLTNPVAKWRSRLLDRLPAGLAAGYALRPSPLTAAERVWRLHRAPETAERAAAERHALAVTAFARAVFAGTERHLLTAAAHPPLVAWPSPGPPRPATRCRPRPTPTAAADAPPLAWPTGPTGPESRAAAAGEPLPWLDLDVDYLAAGGPADPVLLARLNEPGRPVPLAPAAFTAALLGDGVTTAAEAHAATGADLPAPSPSSRAANLTAPRRSRAHRLRRFPCSGGLGIQHWWSIIMRTPRVLQRQSLRGGGVAAPALGAVAGRAQPGRPSGRPVLGVRPDRLEGRPLALGGACRPGPPTSRPRCAGSPFARSPGAWRGSRVSCLGRRRSPLHGSKACGVSPAGGAG